MARAADEGAAGGLPFVKFNKIGKIFVGAFGSHVEECRRQQHKFKTGELVWKDKPGPNGEKLPALEEVLYLVAMPGTTAQVGADDALVAIEPGAAVRFAIAGFKWGQVIEARKGLEPYAGFAAGRPCSGDIYTIELVGRSKETDNPDAVRKAGLNVVNGRVVMTTDDEFERWAMARIRANQDTNAAKDYRITLRRPTAAEKRWEQEADALFEAKPWKRQAVAVGAAAAADDHDHDDVVEPF